MAGLASGQHRMWQAAVAPIAIWMKVLYTI
jgi:hypothetical protein